MNREQQAGMAREIAKRQEAVAFTVPGQPFPKQRARVVNGHAYTPAKTVEAERKVGLFADQAMRGKPPISREVALWFTFYRADKRRVDLDNLEKLAQDAMNGRCFTDDSLIVYKTSEKKFDKDNPRTEIRIEVA